MVILSPNVYTTAFNGTSKIMTVMMLSVEFNLFSKFGGALVKIVETPWKGLYKASLFLFGIPFFLIGLILLIIGGNWAFVLNGAVWIILGVGLKIKSTYNRRKLETLKREGLCYEGSVVSIIPAPWVKIGSYVTSRVECVYKTEKCDCLVKSGYHLLLPFDRREDLYAKIYFDHNNLENYIVELFRRDTGVKHGLIDEETRRN